MYRRFKHLKFKAVSRQNIYSERTDLDKATAETWVTELLASMDAMDQRAWRLLYELRWANCVFRRWANAIRLYVIKQWVAIGCQKGSISPLQL